MHERVSITGSRLHPEEVSRKGRGRKGKGYYRASMTRRSKSTKGKGIYSSEHEHRYRMVCG